MRAGRFLPGSVCRRLGGLLACLALGYLLPVAAAETDAPRPVAIGLRLLVDHTGRVTSELADGADQDPVTPTTLEERVGERFFAGHPERGRLQVKYPGLLRKEIERRLSRWEPVTAWHAPDRKPSLTPAQLPAAGAPRELRAWLEEVQPGAGAQLLDWIVPSADDAEDNSSADFRTAANNLCLGLQAGIDDPSFSRLGNGQGPLQLVLFPPRAISQVEVRLPQRAATDAHAGNAARLQAQLNAAAAGVTAWFEELQLQRLTFVMRGRGFWQDPTLAGRGAWSPAGWAGVPDESGRLKVTPPHLSRIGFKNLAGTERPDPAARFRKRELAWQRLSRVLPLFLDRSEIAVVERAAELWIRPANATRPLTAEEERLRAVMGPGRGGIHLFVYVDKLRALQRSAGAAPALVNSTNAHLVSREQIDALAQAVANAEKGDDAPDGFDLTTEFRNADSGNGAVEISFTPSVRFVETTEAPAASDESAAARTEPAAGKPGALRQWLHRNHVSIQAGVSKSAEQPFKSELHLAAANPESIGSFALDLTYSRRLSANFDWQPGEDITKSSAGRVLPSEIGVFTETAERRPLDGADFELKSDGLRLGKSWPLGDTGFRGRPPPTLSAEFAIARVQNQAVTGAPELDQFQARATYLRRAPTNPWDARERRFLRVAGSFGGRGDGDLDLWEDLEVQWNRRAGFGDGQWFYDVTLKGWTAFGKPPTDLLPYVGGNDGVRGVRSFGVPARSVVLLRSELWTPLPFVQRDLGIDQTWFQRFYDLLSPAVFVDAAWAERIHEPVPTRPWFVSPGVGLRCRIDRITLNLDYAYGLARPSSLGGHRFVFGVSVAP